MQFSPVSPCAKCVSRLIRDVFGDFSPPVQKRVWINWQGLHRESWFNVTGLIQRIVWAHTKTRSERSSASIVGDFPTLVKDRAAPRLRQSARARLSRSLCAFALAFTFAYARALQLTLVIKTQTLHIARLVFSRSAAASRFTYFHILHVILIHGTQSAVAGAPVRKRRLFHRTLALLGFSPASKHLCRVAIRNRAFIVDFEHRLLLYQFL